MKSPRVHAPRKISLTERLTSAIGSVPSLILHTVVFISSFLSAFLGYVDINTMLLVLTTLVSLEAIYLAIFIQMTVNVNTESLREVEEDIEEIQEDVEELGEDVEEIQEDVEEMSKDVDEITEDMDEIQKDIEEMSEEETRALADRQPDGEPLNLDKVTNDVRKILTYLETLKKGE